MDCMRTARSSLLCLPNSKQNDNKKTIINSSQKTKPGQPEAVSTKFELHDHICPHTESFLKKLHLPDHATVEEKMKDQRVVSEEYLVPFTEEIIIDEFSLLAFSCQEDANLFEQKWKRRRNFVIKKKKEFLKDPTAVAASPSKGKHDERKCNSQDILSPEEVEFRKLKEQHTALKQFLKEARRLGAITPEMKRRWKEEKENWKVFKGAKNKNRQTSVPIQSPPQLSLQHLNKQDLQKKILMSKKKFENKRKLKGDEPLLPSSKQHEEKRRTNMIHDYLPENEPSQSECVKGDHPLPPSPAETIEIIEIDDVEEEPVTSATIIPSAPLFVPALERDALHKVSTSFHDQPQLPTSYYCPVPFSCTNAQKYLPFYKPSETSQSQFGRSTSGRTSLFDMYSKVAGNDRPNPERCDVPTPMPRMPSLFELHSNIMKKNEFQEQGNHFSSQNLQSGNERTGTQPFQNYKETLGSGQPSVCTSLLENPPRALEMENQQASNFATQFNNHPTSGSSLPPLPIRPFPRSIGCFVGMPLSELYGRIHSK